MADKIRVHDATPEAILRLGDLHAAIQERCGCAIDPRTAGLVIGVFETLAERSSILIDATCDRVIVVMTPKAQPRPLRFVGPTLAEILHAILRGPSPDVLEQAKKAADE